MLKICGGFEGALGLSLIVFPRLVLPAIFGGGLSGDLGFLLARIPGVLLVVLGSTRWPTAEGEVPASIVWVQFAFNLSTACYLGYVRLAEGAGAMLLWPLCALHALMALIMVWATYERVWPLGAARANLH
jgi:hypothetical protein